MIIFIDKNRLIRYREVVCFIPFIIVAMYKQINEKSILIFMTIIVAVCIGAVLYYYFLFEPSGEILFRITDAVLPAPDKMGYGILYMVAGICLAYILFFIPYAVFALIVLVLAFRVLFLQK